MAQTPQSGVSRVLGQNGIEQNGTDKMVQTNCHGQIGTDQIIKQSINLALTENIIFTSISLLL